MKKLELRWVGNTTAHAIFSTHGYPDEKFQDCSFFDIPRSVWAELDCPTSITVTIAVNE